MRNDELEWNSSGQTEACYGCRFLENIPMEWLERHDGHELVLRTIVSETIRNGALGEVTLEAFTT